MTEFDEAVKRLREMIRIGFYNLTAHPEHADLEDMDIDPAAMATRPCQMTVHQIDTICSKGDMRPCGYR